MDKIMIHALKAEATIGVYDWERRIRQRLVFDLELATDARSAAQSDSLAGALDYKKIAKRVREFVESSEFHLVESLAEAIAGMLISEFGVRWVRVELQKLGAITGAESVGVTIERDDGAS